MAYSAKVILDSIGPSGCRITTVECTYPAAVHWDHLRHRSFSFSVASNRAIPTREYIRRVIADPAHPFQWGKNQSGMVARAPLTGWRRWVVSRIWLWCRWPAVVIAWLCWKLGAHKEVVNWLLFPWAWITLIKTATDWSNFFALRCHPDARPEMRHMACMVRDVRDASVPQKLYEGEWHLPFVAGLWDDLPQVNWDLLCRVSAARCARVSLLKHDEERDRADELLKAEQLLSHGHMSPFEHQAQALATAERVANFCGFRPYRSTIPNEHDFGLILAAKKEGENGR